VSFEEAQTWTTDRPDVAFAETSALTKEGTKEALEKFVDLFPKYRRRCIQRISAHGVQATLIDYSIGIRLPTAIKQAYMTMPC
jgi:hypothetical protein